MFGYKRITLLLLPVCYYCVLSISCDDGDDSDDADVDDDYDAVQKEETYSEVLNEINRLLKY